MGSRKFKVALLSHFDSQNIKNWSGSAYNIGRSLEDQDLEVVYIGGLKTKISIYQKFKYKLNNLIYKKFWDINRDPKNLKDYASQIKTSLDKHKPDIILSIAEKPISFLEYNKPIVFLGDAVFSSLLDFYDEYSNL